MWHIFVIKIYLNNQVTNYKLCFQMYESPCTCCDLFDTGGGGRQMYESPCMCCDLFNTGGGEASNV